MGKLNRRKIIYAGPSKSEFSETANILQTIRAVIRSTWNRRYDLRHEQREAKELYLELRRYCKINFGDTERATMLRTLAEAREWLVEHPNSSLAHVFLFGINKQKGIYEK